MPDPRELQESESLTRLELAEKKGAMSTEGAMRMANIEGLDYEGVYCPSPHTIDKIHKRAQLINDMVLAEERWDANIKRLGELLKGSEAEYIKPNYDHIKKGFAARNEVAMIPGAFAGMKKAQQQVLQARPPPRPIFPSSPPQQRRDPYRR